MVDEFLGNVYNLPTIDKCLEFAESETNPLKLKLESIRMSRKSPYFRDDWTEYVISDPRFYRIQRRCSRIDKLHLKMPSGSSLDHETIDILRLYVGNLPVSLVKVTGLAKFDVFSRLVFLESSLVTHLNAGTPFSNWLGQILLGISRLTLDALTDCNWVSHVRMPLKNNSIFRILLEYYDEFRLRLGVIL